LRYVSFYFFGLGYGYIHKTIVRPGGALQPASFLMQRATTPMPPALRMAGKGNRTFQVERQRLLLL